MSLKFKILFKVKTDFQLLSGGFFIDWVIFFFFRIYKGRFTGSVSEGKCVENYIIFI